MNTLVVGFLPLIGGFGGWVPVSVYLATLGRPTSAAIRFVSGSVFSVSELDPGPMIINRTEPIDVATIAV